MLRKQRQRPPSPGRQCAICGLWWCPIYYSHGKPKRIRAKAQLKTCSPACYAILHRQNEPKRIPALARGAKHPGWKGGVGELYRRGGGWAKITGRVRRQQSYQCARCGRSEQDIGKKLDVHHIVPFHNFPTAREANRRINLTGLCRACHSIADAETGSRQLSLGLVLNGRAFRPGKARGERDAAAKMTAELVLLMRRLRAEGASIKTLAARFPVSATQAQYICCGKSWKHVGGPLSSGRKVCRKAPRKGGMLTLDAGLTFLGATSPGEFVCS